MFCQVLFVYFVPKTKDKASSERYKNLFLQTRETKVEKLSDEKQAEIKKQGTERIIASDGSLF